MLPAHPLRIAAAAYPVESHRTWTALSDKLSSWSREARAAGAHIAVLPEYAGLEAALVDPPATATAAEWCARSAARAGPYLAECRMLALRDRLWLLSGSLPVRVGSLYVNRAFHCRPDGVVYPIDKQVLTPWEARHTPLVPGPAMPRIAAGSLKIGSLICYDGEFPPLAQALAPDVLLMPACTDAPSGDARLRVAARARALELQAVTVHAPLLGAVPRCQIVDENTGRAGIYAPPDTPFPDDGVLAQGATDTPGWTVAEIPAGALSDTRSGGAVAPRADMGHASARAARATERHAPEVAP